MKLATLRTCLGLLLIAACPLPAQDDRAEARRLLDEGRYARAAQIYERLHVANMDDYEVCMGFGRSLYMQHENSRSLGLFERAGRLTPSSAEAPLWQGYVLERSGVAGLDRQDMMARPTLNDAVTAYRRAIVLDSKLMEARLSAIRVLFLLENFDDALIEIAAAREVDAEHVDVMAYWLGVLYRSERFAEFVAACAEVGDSMSLDLGRMLDAHARLGQVEAAEALFQRMFEEGYSGRNEPYAFLSRAWAESPRLEDQIAVLQRHLERRPDEWLGQYYLGYALAVAGRLGEARGAFEAYLEKDPESTTTRAHLVRIARLDRRLDDARRLAEILIGQAPDAPTAREELSATVLSLVDRKEFAAALSLHSRLYDLDSENPDFARNQAILLKENGRLEDSLAIITYLVEEAPVETSRLASIINDQALGLKGLGRLDEAIAAFQRAARTWVWEADARENLGVLYQELGRKEEARLALLDAIEARRAGGETDERAFWRARYHLRALERRP